ncbi:MAG TPA: hypothetical protein VN873_07530 [Candidatus Angelobacter sp.]|nr:hypothetical protein [Candidatus Angelobacter sp.]
MVALVACVFWFKWKRDEPRRDSLASLENLYVSLESNSSSLLNQVVLPSVVNGRTQAERIEFLTKVLRDEVSGRGISALRHGAAFGELNRIFPEEASRWADQASVNATNCFAFRMEKNGVRAEVVVYRDGDHYLVLRCNNVKQMAESN